MTTENTTKTNKAMSFNLVYVSVALAVLKLVGVLSISWFWVLAPVLLPIAIFVACIAVLFVGTLIGGLLSGFKM